MNMRIYFTANDGITTHELFLDVHKYNVTDAMMRIKKWGCQVTRVITLA